MHQFFVSPEQIHINDKSVMIVGTDVNHIRNVLRMKAGEEISVSNGQDGREYRCGIRSMEEDRIICELRFIKEDRVELPSRVYLFQALPKADKMELIVQKAVELGVYKIIPVAAKRCIVRLDVMAQFSFLMVLVPILGEAFLEVVGGGVSSSTVGALPLCLGFLSAFLSGLFACKVMIAIVKKARLSWFALYCLVVAAAIFIFG